MVTQISFHAWANGRRRKNTISVVEDEGRNLYSEGEKKEYFYNKFTNVLAPYTTGSALLGD